MNPSNIKITLNKPIIGVFVNNVFIRKLNTKINKFRTTLHYKRFIELAQANKEAKTTLYFFCEKYVNTVDCTIEGIFYNEVNEEWERREFPFPHVF